MNTEDTVQQIELNIKESRKVADLGDALARLKTNRDFKKVILEGFFEQEAIRLVHLKADTNMQSAESQKAILTQLDAVGALAQYFRTLEFRASLANKSIQFDEQTRDELLLEGGE